MTLMDFALKVVDPFGIIRFRILKPVSVFTLSLYDYYRMKTKEGVLTIRDLIFRMIVIVLAISIVFSMSVFMYVVFYYTYMPAIAHTRPVNMQFETCSKSEDGLCSFPNAHVSLTKKQQLLMVGQSYRIIVNIDMPESPQNQNMGMFLVCTDLRDSESKLRDHSCRSAMLRYKSPLLQYISTWLLSPLLILGIREERQTVPVELFSSYNEDQLHPITDVYIEVQSKVIQFYSVTLNIIADFSGLRYIMFNWPVLSAALGISTNLFFIIIIFLLSWYNWTDTKWIMDVRDHYHRFRQTKSSLSTNIDASSSSHHLFDDDELSILDEKSSNKSDDVEDVSGANVIDDEGEAEATSTGLKERIKRHEYKI